MMGLIYEFIDFIYKIIYDSTHRRKQYDVYDLVDAILGSMIIIVLIIPVILTYIYLKIYEKIYDRIKYIRFRKTKKRS